MFVTCDCRVSIFQPELVAYSGAWVALSTMLLSVERNRGHFTWTLEGFMACDLAVS